MSTTKTHALVYVGKRLDKSGKIYDGFLDEETGKLSYFQNLKFIQFGYRYEVDVEPDGGFSMRQRPKEIDGPVDLTTEAMIKHAAQDVADRMEKQRIDRLKRFDAHPELKAIARRIKPFTENLKFAGCQDLVTWLVKEALK